VEVGLAKGKQAHDKRDSERDRDWQRERSRLLKSR
jgi:SsrA-binding protein